MTLSENKTEKSQGDNVVLPGAVQADFGKRIEAIKAKIQQRMSRFSSKDDVRHPVLKDFFDTANQILLSDDAKRLRCILPVLIAEQCNLSEDDCMDYGIIVELLHYTSLIHDDVIDEDGYRRGYKTLNNEFPNSQAVLIGDYVICMAINYCLKFTHNEKVISLVVEAIKSLVSGIIIEQRLLPKEPTVQRYKEMAVLKTGSLFGLSFGLPFVGEEKLEEAMKCGEIFGILFQIYDDYLDRNDDDPGLNIFGFLSSKEIVSFWDEQAAAFMKSCVQLDLQPTALVLFHHLHELGYFKETSTEDGVLFRLPAI